MGCVDGDKSHGPRGAPGRPPPNKGKPYPIEILIADSPLLGDALEAAGFRLGPNPGYWLSPDGVHLDLMVPEALAGPGRRGADLGVHGRNAVRRSRGIEAALVDRQAITLAALEPEDDRSYELWVAGPSALLVAKVAKIGERTAATGRGVDKDAIDVSRLLRATPTDDLVAGLTTLAGHELSAATTLEAVDTLRRLFGSTTADGVAMAVRAAMPLVEADVDDGRYPNVDHPAPMRPRLVGDHRHVSLSYCPEDGARDDGETGVEPVTHWSLPTVVSGRRRPGLGRSAGRAGPEACRPRGRTGPHRTVVAGGGGLRCSPRRRGRAAFWEGDVVRRWDAGGGPSESAGHVQTGLTAAAPDGMKHGASQVLNTPSKWLVDKPIGRCTIQNMDLSTPLASVVGDARGRLLEAVVRSDRPRSIREWSRRAGVNHAHARSLLKEFEGMGLVSSERVGTSVVIVAVRESALRRRLRGLFLVAEDIVEAAREGARSAPPDVTVTLFGSLARGSSRGGSDVDLCVVAPTDPATEDWIRSYVDNLRAVSCLPVNLLRFTPADWDDAVADRERIVDEIRRDGLVLTGGVDERR